MSTKNPLLHPSTELSPTSRRKGALVASLAAAGLLSLGAVTSPALARGGKDADRDGLTAKQERKVGTNPRKADTDRDLLKDGVEVKRLRTNPRKADTDGDGLRDGREVRDGLNPKSEDSDGDGTSDRYERKGRITAIAGESVTIVSKRGAEVTFIVDVDTYLEGADRDSDGALTLGDFQIGDRVEANLSTDGSRALTLELKWDGDLNEIEGPITAIEGDSVTVLDEGGAEATFLVDVNTYLRAPDRNASGNVSLADFQVGDQVEVHLNEDGTLALSMELEYDKDEYGDDDGYGHDDDSEVEGYVTGIDAGTGSVTLERRGVSTTIVVNGDTFFRGPDRDSSGTVDLADLQVGDEVEARLAADGVTVLSLKVEDDEDEEGSEHGESEKAEAEGTISALTADSVTILRFNGTTLTLTAGVGTRYEVPDRNLSGSESLADFEVGDRVEAKYDPADNSLFKLSFEGGEPEDD